MTSWVIFRCSGSTQSALGALKRELHGAVLFTNIEY